MSCLVAKYVHVYPIICYYQGFVDNVYKKLDFIFSEDFNTRFCLLVVEEQGIIICRSSRLDIIYKESVLKNLAKFTGKNLCRSLFFNKVAGLKFATFKMETVIQMLS